MMFACLSPCMRAATLMLAAILATFPCSSLGQGIEYIETERNNGWFRSPSSAIRVGTKNNPGIKPEFIPQIGVTNILRLSSNYTAVVASIMSAVGERRSLQSDADTEEEKYILPNHRRVVDWINKPFVKYGDTNENAVASGKNVEEELIRVDGYDSGGDGNTTVYVDGILTPFGGKRLNDLTSLREGIPEISKNWTTDLYLTEDYSNMWCNAFPTFSACAADPYFASVSNGWNLTPYRPWSPWLIKQLRIYNDFHLKSYFARYKDLTPLLESTTLNFSVRDVFSSLPNDVLSLWRSGSKRMLTQRMAIIDTLLASCQYAYEPVNYENTIPHESIDYIIKFKNQGVDSEGNVRPLVIPVEFTIALGGEVSIALKDIIPPSYLDFEDATSTKVDVTTNAWYVNTARFSPRAYIDAPYFSVQGLLKEQRTSYVEDEVSIDEEYMWQLLENMGFDQWVESEDSETNFTVLIVGQCYEENSVHKFKTMELHILNDSDNSSEDSSDELYDTYSIPEMYQEVFSLAADPLNIQYTGELYLYIYGGFQYSKPKYESESITDADIISGLSGYANTRKWEIQYAESWYNWQTFFNRYEGAYGTRLKNYKGKSLEEININRCDDVRDLSDEIWQKAIDSYGRNDFMEGTSVVNQIARDISSQIGDIVVRAYSYADQRSLSIPPFYVALTNNGIKTVRKQDDNGEEPSVFVDLGSISGDVVPLTFSGSGNKVDIQSKQNILIKHDCKFNNIRYHRDESQESN